MNQNQQLKHLLPYNLNIIAAVAIGNLGIGFEGDLCYHIKEDLRHFKNITLGKTVIMGKRTWDSLPKKPLEGRRNIVLSHDPDFEAPGAEVFRSLEEALITCKGEVFIIGGESLYRYALPLCDTLYLTEIIGTPQADTFFPRYSEEFQLVYRESHITGDDLSYDFTKYTRVSILPEEC